jgi:hypothetical protein
MLALVFQTKGNIKVGFIVNLTYYIFINILVLYLVPVKHWNKLERRKALDRAPLSKSFWRYVNYHERFPTIIYSSPIYFSSGKGIYSFRNWWFGGWTQSTHASRTCFQL